MNPSPWRRHPLIAGLATVVLVSLAACAPATTGTGTGTGTGIAVGTRTGTDLICTKATKVKILVRTSGADRSYAFSPSRLTLQRGGFLAVTNMSDRVHALVSAPDAGIVTSVLDLKERQVIQFPRAGTFTVQSASAGHRATLRVTVSGDTGCGPPEPTVNIIDGYAFFPSKLSVAATENFAVVNESDTAQSVSCTPGSNGDHTRLEPGETQLLAIDGPGRYTCASRQHPSARLTIRVSD